MEKRTKEEIENWNKAQLNFDVLDSSGNKVGEFVDGEWIPNVRNSQNIKQ